MAPHAAATARAKGGRAKRIAGAGDEEDDMRVALLLAVAVAIVNRYGFGRPNGWLRGVVARGADCGEAKDLDECADARKEGRECVVVVVVGG